MCFLRQQIIIIQLRVFDMKRVYSLLFLALFAILLLAA